jgi:hypothetical protein
MTVAWSADELERIGAAEELRISPGRADGTLRREVPVWVVCVGADVYVRTWYRRDNGWFGQVVHSRQARIRVPGVEAAVAVEDVGDGRGELRPRVDAAYRAKYGRYGESSVAQMVTDDAAATTLLLVPRERAAGGG